MRDKGSASVPEVAVISPVPFPAIFTGFPTSGPCRPPGLPVAPGGGHDVGHGLPPRPERFIERGDRHEDPLLVRPAVELTQGLSWAGFGNPTAGTWVTPNAEAVAPAAEVVEDLGLSPWCLSFEGGGLGIGLTDQDIVDQAWDLDAIASHYAESLSRFTGLPVTGGDEALFTQVALVNELQRFPFMDPRLPFDLLPANWLGRTAPARFQEIRAQWHDAARARWRELAS